MSEASRDDNEARDDAFLRWIPVVPVMAGLMLGVIFIVWATVL